MKHQQVTVDYVSMVWSSFSYLALAGAVWIFLRLIQACFWLPRHLKKQTDIQQMLQEKVDSYEKYILECEEKEKSMMDEVDADNGDSSEKNAAYAAKWKERRECLETLKTELKKIRENGDSYDWDKLLEEELNSQDDETATEAREDENAKGEDGEAVPKAENVCDEQKVDEEKREKENEANDTEDKKDK